MRDKMRRSTIAIILGCAVAFTGVVWAFVGAANPQVDVAQAKTMGGNSTVYLAGSLVPDTLHVSPRAMLVQFTLKDDKGQQVPVEHRGQQPANIADATRVVAVGRYRDGVFHAEKIMTKCPSKYEETRTS